LFEKFGSSTNLTGFKDFILEEFGSFNSSLILINSLLLAFLTAKAIRRKKDAIPISGHKGKSIIENKINPVIVELHRI